MPRSARRSALQPPPAFIAPMLPRLVEVVPDSAEWLHELKHDGYRLHARLTDGNAQLLTRRGLHWADKYPGVAASVAKLPAANAYIDGEVCVLDPETGVSSLRLLQASGRGKYLARPRERAGGRGTESGPCAPLRTEHLGPTAKAQRRRRR